MNVPLRTAGENVPLRAEGMNLLEEQIEAAIAEAKTEITAAFGSTPTDEEILLVLNSVRDEKRAETLRRRFRDWRGSTLLDAIKGLEERVRVKQSKRNS